MLGVVLALAAHLAVGFAQKNLPEFVTPAHLASNGYPWGDSYEQTSWRDAPDTGDTRVYDFTITKTTYNVDGLDLPALLVNGQFPGPTIEANWGDTIQVTLHNQLDEGTAIHWHGFYQHETPWFDGIPSVDQCPIPPGKSLTYTFKADQYGSTWWHSHYDTQYADGLFGAIVIHGPKTEPYDIDLGPVMLTELDHHSYKYEVMLTSDAPFQVPWNNNTLINGKTPFQFHSDTDTEPFMNYTKMEKFQFTPGKVHRLRLINSGTQGVLRIGIDGHMMKVIAEDFTPIIPYETDLVVMGVGQRTDILVTANAAAGSSWFLRADQHSIESFCGASFQPHGMAGIYYGTDTAEVPTSTAHPSLTDYNIEFCQNTELSKTKSLFQKPRPSQPSLEQTYDITVNVNETNNSLFYVNGESERANFNHPILLLSKLGNTSYPYDPQWNVYNFESHSSVRMFVNNTTPFAHAMHLHGHSFWVLAAGLGHWDGSVVDNPIKRDVQIVQPALNDSVTFSYLVLEWELDNPGTWPFHCHIAWHISLGLYINTIEQPDDIKKLNIPPSSAQNCRDWWAWSGSNVVDEIDSGL